MTQFRRFSLMIPFCFGALLAAGTTQSIYADVRLPSVFSDHMVLQREATLPFWGWADPGETVTVQIGDSSQSDVADDSGKWSVRMPMIERDGAFSVSITGKNSIELSDVVMGEVWVCSGQSNMQWSVKASNNPDEEIAAAQYPEIRLFHVPRIPAGTPQEDVDAQWQRCSPETVADFSAVSYYFGRYLHNHISSPIGLIHTSWGGTRIEPWTPPVGFESVPELSSITDEINQSHQQWEEAAKAAEAQRGDVPAHPLANRGKPTGLYNGMVHALVPFAIKGAIWYQGESNRNDGLLYEQKMQALIRGWRAIWERGDFPFYYVQLAPYRKYQGDPTLLPQIWEAQNAVLDLPNTGMAVTTDIGNLDNIHPKNKQDVGKRLALWALAKTYGKGNTVYSGPLYESMKTEGNTIRLRFQHVGSGLASRDGEPLSWFTIAGDDGNFVEATAVIDGDSVVVSSDQVGSPKAVRMGWHQDAEPNLMSKDGLPASPFRTDR